MSKETTEPVQQPQLHEPFTDTEKVRDSLEKESYSGESSDRELSKEEATEQYVHIGVSRVSAVRDVINTYGTFELRGVTFHPWKWILVILVFLQGYTTGLDGNMSGLAQSFALDEFDGTPLQGTFNTVKSVVGAAVFVPYARISDRVGRIETWTFALICFIIGRVVTTSAHNVGSLMVGTVFWELGYAGFRFLASVLMADISGLRDRVFFLNIYEMPIIINLWVSGNIAQRVAGNEHRWRWDFGIGCIDVPIMTLVLMAGYGWMQYIAKRRGTLPPQQFKRPGQSAWAAITEFLWKVDIIGTILFAAGLALFLVSITLAGGINSKWNTAHVIAMIVVGGCLIIIFGIWEWFLSPAPFIPKKRLERTFYIAMLADICWRIGLAIEMDYVQYILQVAFDQGTLSTQRLGQLYNFMQCCTSVVIGIMLHFWPHPKPFAFGGSLVGLLGMGLMYKYRTAFDGSGIHGYIGADVVVGIGGGMQRFPMWTLVHSGVPHDQMALTTAFLMTFYQVGGAVGSAIGGALWTQRLAQHLMGELGPELGKKLYNAPLKKLKMFPMGSPQRNGLLSSYSYIQRLLVIVSIALAATTVVLMLGLRSYVVGTRQSLKDETREEQRKKMDSSTVNRLRTMIGAW